MKRRCNFELQFCELSGVPTSFESIRVVIDHRDGKRRYAATEPIKLSFGTAAVPSLAFQCGIYPSKTVQLRLMAGSRPEPDQEGRPRTPRLLGRSSSSLNWQLLASAPLTLGQLAPTNTDQDAGDTSTVASSTALTPVSTRGHSMDQATLNQLPGMPQSTLTGTPEGAGTASPFHTMSGADEDDAGSDSGQLFSTDSLAAAAASLVEQQQQQQQQYDGSAAGSGTSLPLGKGPVKGGRTSSGEESGVSQVSGLWVAGDSQVTRLTLQWSKEPGAAGTTDATVMDQEVVVIAKLMEARPSFSNLFGLRLSPSKNSLAQQNASALDQQAGGYLTPTRTSRQWDAVQEKDQGLSESDKPPRRVTFDAAAPSALAPAAPPLPDTTGDLLANSGDKKQSEEAAAAAAAAAAEDDAAQESAKRDFLALILSTLTSASSIDSEAGSSIMAAASPAQLAAAASLPRAPSTKDLALFAAAAGLPFETVTQAAASTRLSVTGANNGSRSSSSRGKGSPGDSERGSPSQAPKPPLPPAMLNAGSFAASGNQGNGSTVVSGAASGGVIGRPAAAAVAAAAAAAAQAAGLQAADAESADIRVSPASVPAATTTAPSPFALDAGSAASAPSGPASSSAAASAPTTVSGVSDDSKVVTSTALVSSSAEGAAGALGWEPQQLAVVTVTAAVPEGDLGQQQTPSDTAVCAPDQAKAAAAAAVAGGSLASKGEKSGRDAAGSFTSADTAARPDATNRAVLPTAAGGIAESLRQTSSASSRGLPADLSVGSDSAGSSLLGAPQLSGPGSFLAGLSQKYNTLVSKQQQQQDVDTLLQQQQQEELSGAQATGQPQNVSELGPHELLAMMPGLQAAGSIMRQGTERQVSAGLGPQANTVVSQRPPVAAAVAAGSAGGNGSSGTVSMSAGRGVGHRDASVSQSGPLKASTLYWVTNPDNDIGGSNAAIKGGAVTGPGSVPAAPAGPEQQDSLAAGTAASQPDKPLPVYTGETGSWEAAPPPPSPRLLAAAVGSEAAAADMMAAAVLPAGVAADATATAGASAPAATVAEVQEMLAYPSTATATGLRAAAAGAAAAAAPGFTAPVSLQQQKSAVPTATGSIYPTITARGASTEITAAAPAVALAAGVPSRLTAVLAVRQNSLTSSTQLMLTQPAPTRTTSAAVASSVASLLAPAAGAALATGAAVLPTVAGSLAAASVGLSVFLLRQATWLFHVGWLLGGRLLLWAALAGPRAVLWAAQQFSPYLAGPFSSESSRQSAVVPALGAFSSSAGGVGGVQGVGVTAGGSRSRTIKVRPASGLLQRKPHGSSTSAATAGTAAAPTAESGVSPAEAAIMGARGTPSSPGANHSNIPPSLGGPGFMVWAPSAGRSAAASIAAAALSPLALLLQWPARTATILFEVAVWGGCQLLLGPLALLLGVLKYCGLLPARSPGRPALSSVAAAGGFAAQGQIMPPPGEEVGALPAPLAPILASAAVPPSAQAGGLLAGEAVGSVSGGGVPLSATAVPEEHEVCGEEVVSPSGRIISPGHVPYPELPPTPAPSMEVPGSGAQRTWSMTFLTAALSRLGSASLTATPATDTASTAAISTTPVLPAAAPAGETYSSSSAAAPLRPLSNLGAGRGLGTRLTKAAAGTAAYGSAAAGDQHTSGISSSRSTSGSVSRASSASSSIGSGQLGGGNGSWWFGSRRAPPTEVSRLQGLQGMQPLGAKSPAVSVRTSGLVPPAGGAASSVIQQVNSSIDTFSGRGWWPSWAPWGAAKARPLAVAAVAPTGAPMAARSAVPATPPPTPLASFSHSNSASSTMLGNGSTGVAAWPWASFGFPAALRTSVVPASSSAQRSAAGASSEVAQVVAAATEGGSHLMAVAAHVIQAFMLLVIEPIAWLWAAFSQLGQSGVMTAAWLASLVLWWAVLPVRLVWWGLLVPGRVVVGVWEGVKWFAEHVSLPHDDRVELHTG